VTMATRPSKVISDTLHSVAFGWWLTATGQ
jgi:hypothetical protein